MVKGATNADRVEARKGRTFMLALRTEGVHDSVARMLTRKAIEDYRRNAARGRAKHANHMLSPTRAKELARLLAADIGL